MATFLGSVFVFLMVITLHEFGHFAAAKAVGIKVNEFAVGMGPKLLSRQKGETLYTVRALPIGGFCAMEGETEDSPDPRSFQQAPLWARFTVVVSGAAMNFILAIIAFFIVSLIMGVQTQTIDSVIPNSPAMTAGIRSGDRIIEINNRPVESWDDIIDRISSSKGEITVTGERENKKLKFKLTPTEEDGRKVIGIVTRTETKPLSSLKFAFSMTGKVIMSIFLVFKMMFQRTFKTDMLAGPVGVISMIGESTAAGLVPLLFMLGLISANLGVVNLLPIPALDGGKILFLLIEKLRGEPVPEEKEGLITIIGMVFLFSLMIYITIFADLKRILAG